MIAAAILARQLGIDLDRQVEAKLGSASWHAQLLSAGDASGRSSS